MNELSFMLSLKYFNKNSFKSNYLNFLYDILDCAIY